MVEDIFEFHDWILAESQFSRRESPDTCCYHTLKTKDSSCWSLAGVMIQTWLITALIREKMEKLAKNYTRDVQTLLFMMLATTKQTLPLLQKQAYYLDLQFSILICPLG